MFRAEPSPPSDPLREVNTTRSGRGGSGGPGTDWTWASGPRAPESGRRGGHVSGNNDRSDERKNPHVVLAVEPSAPGDPPARVVVELVQRSGTEASQPPTVTLDGARPL